MIPLSEWPPNVHSFIIHFPFALLTTAVLIDLASLFTTRWIGVRITAVALFTLGALGTLVAFFTGQTAAEAVKLPLAAVATLNDHADWAELTFWFFGLYAIVRLVGLWVDHKSRDWARHWVHVLFFLVGASGLSLLVTTEILGNRLVYKYGVGVQAIPMEHATTHAPNPDQDQYVNGRREATYRAGRLGVSMMGLLRPVKSENYDEPPGPDKSGYRTWCEGRERKPPCASD